MLRGVLGSGGGAAVGGTGTTNTIPRWTGPSTLGDSGLTDSGTEVSFTNRLIRVGSGNAMRIIGGGVGNAYFMDLGTVTFRRGDGANNGGAVQASSLFVGTTFWGTALSDGVAAFSGNVGIGTASPGRKLEVLDATTGAGVVQGVRLTGNGGNYYDIGRDPVTGAGVWAGSQAGVPLITFSQAGTERARIDSSGNLILNTANTGATIQAAGTSQGLKLQGTGGTNNTDPNVLDFYADGGTANSGGVTWTPSLRFGGATTGITYSAQVGRYTRIGNMIHATGVIALTSKGSATGSVSIAGLPTSANLADLNSSITIGYLSNITFGGQATGWIPPNSGTITLMKSTSGTTPTVMQDTDFAATSTIFFSVSYPVT